MFSPFGQPNRAGMPRPMPSDQQPVLLVDETEVFHAAHMYQQQGMPAHPHMVGTQPPSDYLQFMREHGLTDLPGIVQAPDDAEKPKPKPRPTLRRDVPVLPARYTRHCGGERGPGQVTVYDVHRQAVGAAAHKVEAVRAAHVDPCAATVGGLFNEPAAREPTEASAAAGPPDDADDDEHNVCPSAPKSTPPSRHNKATGAVYVAAGPFPLRPVARAVAQSAEEAATIAGTAAAPRAATGRVVISVYGPLTDAAAEDPAMAPPPAAKKMPPPPPQIGEGDRTRIRANVLRAKRAELQATLAKKAAGVITL